MNQPIDDPQIVLQADVKKSRNSDNEVITFHLTVLFFRLSFIVNMPYEGESKTIVFVRGRMAKNFFPSENEQSKPHYPPPRRQTQAQDVEHD